MASAEEGAPRPSRSGLDIVSRAYKEIADDVLRDDVDTQDVIDDLGPFRATRPSRAKKRAIMTATLALIEGPN